MTVRRVRPGLYVAGAVLAVGCLVGARALTAGNGSDGPKTAAPPPGNGKVGGPVVLGTVDSDPQPVDYKLPPILPSGTVAEVFVRDGQEVKAGERLYTFDTTLQTRELEKAAAAVAVAKTKVAEAEEGAKRHAREVDVMKQSITNAEKKRTMYADHYNLILANLREADRVGGAKRTDEEFKALIARNSDLYKASVEHIVAGSEVGLLKARLGVLEAADPQVVVKQAVAGVKLAEAEEAKARTAVDLCTVRAKTAGTVEQVKIGPGSTLGVSTRDPALWIVPAGTRIVRAEVEAEFAHRLSDDIKGREVTVYDHTDPKLTYKGKVLRVSGTFLPKRSDGLIPNDTRVLEALVEVADPAPAGRPPLRVGQRVRVNLGQ